MLSGGSFQFPHNLVHSTLLYSIDFSLPITICFKNARFSLLLSRESGFPGGISGKEFASNAGEMQEGDARNSGLDPWGRRDYMG